MNNLEETARSEAKVFIERETQFHLGFLPTEQSHPRTRDFSSTVKRNTARGAAQLLSVDLDIPAMARRIFAGREFAALEEAVYATAREGGRIAFSGCGATGRLAIILEKMWRVFWEEAADGHPERRARYLGRAEASYSIMTGGDRALIRSVENFEDYITFGRRQVQDAGLGEGDLLVAVTEGGETSSVIGTALEGFEGGARVFFVYNNPSEILAEHIERSRRVIEMPGITKLDLSTGPMALSGSTRLQATSAEMLVVGAALERACARLLAEESAGSDAAAGGGRAAGIDREGRAPGGRQSVRAGARAPAPGDYPRLFEELVMGLSSGEALRGVAAAIDLESEVYRAGALVTYLCDDYLLDIISDTTERTPTFMLPPFRASGDTTSPPSWAFTKDPVRLTHEAWRHLLRREPRGIEWKAGDYETMGASERIRGNPPKLDRGEILSYAIGREEDASRSEKPGSALLLVNVGDPPTGAVAAYFEGAAKSFTRKTVIDIALPSASGSGARGSLGAAHTIAVPLSLPSTPMRLLWHLAVKLFFNTVSTATMGKLGRIRGNWMVQMDPTNKKLVDRATRIVAELAHISYEAACEEVHRTIVERREAPRSYERSSVAQTLERLGVEVP